MIKPGLLNKPGFFVDINILQSAEADFVCVVAISIAESYLCNASFDINTLQSAEADFVCVAAISIAEYQPILYFRRICCLKK